METPREYYTYAYLREDRTPYYVGKGKGDRLYKKFKGETRPPKDKSRIIFLKQNLTEQEAFKHEVYMIAVFGRKDLGTGILRNKTDGGEGSSGAIVSEETRKKISEKVSGKKHYLYGKSPSEETRKKLSEITKGENSYWYGKTLSEEHKRKLSEAKKGKKPPNYGKAHSEETKKKLSKAKKGKNNPSYGKRWWNDGCGHSKRSLECPGEGWVLGRGNSHKDTFKQAQGYLKSGSFYGIVLLYNKNP